MTATKTKLISAETRLCAVLGDPVGHSLSPLIHNRWYGEHSIDAVYLALPVKKGHVGQALKTLAITGAVGANITVPHKLEALEACDRLSEEARRIGAVNSVRFETSGMTGDNTDAQGFAQDLRARASKASFAKVSLWGAGGAAKAVLVALKGLGTKEVLIINRTQDKAETMIRSFKVKEQNTTGEKDSMALQAVSSWHENEDFVSTSDLFVNASTQGMTGIATDENYFPDFASVVRNDPSEKLAYDLVYNPSRTVFIERAQKANIATLGGIGMLVRQAAVSFETWFGIAPVVSDALLDSVTAALERG